MVTEAEKRSFETVPTRSIEADIQSSIQPKDLSRSRFCKYLLAGGALAAGAVFASQIPKVEAHFPGANVEIYKSVEGNTPTIDGIYDMAQKEVDVVDPVTNESKKAIVDEWNDAFWIELPKRFGNLTAYSGYKYVMEEQALYMAHAIPSITELNSEINYAAGTCFDPKHDGGDQTAKPDDFIVLPLLNRTPKSKGFAIYVRYGQSNGDFGPYENPPKGLVANSTICATPFSSTPHLFYEVRADLSIGNLRNYIDSTIGIAQDCWNQNLGDDLYPMGQGDFIVKNWADATFSKGTNPNITTPPTIVPEFLSPQTGAVISLGIGSATLYFHKKKISRRTFIGLPEK